MNQGKTKRGKSTRGKEPKGGDGIEREKRESKECVTC